MLHEVHFTTTVWSTIVRLPSLEFGCGTAAPAPGYRGCEVQLPVKPGEGWTRFMPFRNCVGKSAGIRTGS